MFDEKYIMTGIVSILVVAAWQKPDFYVEQLSSKIIVTVFACLLLLATWDISLAIAISNLPPDIESGLKKTIVDSIQKTEIPTTWHIFTVLLAIGSGTLEWLTRSMLLHDKKKRSNNEQAEQSINE